jgi:hypothetical protein
MPNRPPTELDRVLHRIEKGELALNSESLEIISREIGRLFGVAPDEVAVMELVRSGRALKFVLPEKLRVVGEIPLTSTTALAARSVRERRADIVNNFASSRHAIVFEGVPLGRRQNEVIQKIMSIPILQGDTVVGAAQISRKGISQPDAGPDFTAKDLTALQGLNGALRRFLALPRVAAAPPKPAAS